MELSVVTQSQVGSGVTRCSQVWLGVSRCDMQSQANLNCSAKISTANINQCLLGPQCIITKGVSGSERRNLPHTATSQSISLAPHCRLEQQLLPNSKADVLLYG